MGRRSVAVGGELGKDRGREGGGEGKGGEIQKSAHSWAGAHRKQVLMDIKDTGPLVLEAGGDVFIG